MATLEIIITTEQHCLLNKDEKSFQNPTVRRHHKKCHLVSKNGGFNMEIRTVECKRVIVMLHSLLWHNYDFNFIIIMTTYVLFCIHACRCYYAQCIHNNIMIVVVH